MNKMNKWYNDIDFWFGTLIVSGVLVVIFSCPLYYGHKNKCISDMVKAGANPIEVRISLNGTGGDSGIALLASLKERK